METLYSVATVCKDPSTCLPLDPGEFTFIHFSIPFNSLGEVLLLLLFNKNTLNWSKVTIKNVTKYYILFNFLLTKKKYSLHKIYIKQHNCFQHR